MKWETAFLSAKYISRGASNDFTASDYADSYCEAVNYRLAGNGDASYLVGDDESRQGAINKIEEAINEYRGIGKELLYVAFFQYDLDDED